MAYDARMRQVIVFALLAIAGAALAAQSPAAPSAPPGWKLLWSDEFDQASVDTKTWRYSDGGGGWGNGELQKYTNLPENVRTEDGALVIEARKTGDGYTSGRISTRGTFWFTYGRVESRMKIPQTQSIWPAFWMLGDTNGKNWPSCGEIDIMEAIGKEPRTIHGTVHGPGYSRDKGPGKAYVSPASLSDDWHVVAVEWDPTEIRWYMDGVQYFAFAAKDVPAGKKWVFDHDFYLIVNLAVGGLWPDYPDATTVLPQRFVVDYIRIYQRQ